MEDTNVTVEATPQTPAPVANPVAPATAETKTAKVLGANLKLTENKFEYFLLVLEGEQQGVAIWPNELEQLLKQDEAICMQMMGFENFWKVMLLFISSSLSGLTIVLASSARQSRHLSSKCSDSVYRGQPWCCSLSLSKTQYFIL